MSYRRRIGIALAALVYLAIAARSFGQDAVALPPGVRANWNLAEASRETTATRERVCINGLWRWQPTDSAIQNPKSKTQNQRRGSANGGTLSVPASGWGYFKVPGCWPGITDYLQKDCQTVFAHPRWKNANLAAISTAWYERQVAIPASWAGRRIALRADYVNSVAAVYVDDARVGEIRFPGGELDLTAVCRPGRTHRLRLRVTALPLKAVMLSFSDTSSQKTVEGSVERRGLCGDLYLESAPAGARIEDVKVDTSVQRDEITIGAGLPGLSKTARYTLQARVLEQGRTVATLVSRPFTGGEVRDGRFAYTARWRPARLWDIHTPGNTYRLSLSLRDGAGRTLDVAQPARFGYREFSIRGRDFALNGTRIFLSAVPLDNAQVGAAWATYEGARESLLRLKSFGINFVYTHNYGCEPGTHLGFEEILRAADDVGMLVALSQPHFGQYDWDAPDADRANGYARHAAFYARVAGNHPCVVAYAMSHNATGYHEDINPDMMDGVQAPRDNWAMNNVKRALRAEAIVKRLDPARIVYHHSSGSLSALYTVNFYPNFVPIQELSDWFERWSTHGVKPLFLCEYGAPFTWDWTMYRGWYKGERTFGSARVPWEFCIAEWNAQFLGDAAYRITDLERANLRWEGRQFREGKLWYRWDYPTEVGSNRFDDRMTVMGAYIADNWRAHRTWRLSGNSPWEHDVFWRLRDGVKHGRRDLKVDWDHLQRPGFSPDYLDERYERMDLAYERADWLPLAPARALYRNNMPLLGYIAGRTAHFTSKDHDFLPGETVEKQLVVINNSRRTVTCRCSWSIGLPAPLSGHAAASIRTGDQARLPVRFVLPPSLRSGEYTLSAAFRFSDGTAQTDSFSIHVLAHRQAPPAGARFALWDPQGDTARTLDRLGISYRRVEATAGVAPDEVLLIGRGALTLQGAAPDLRRVRDDQRVVVFEQTSEALERRLGFRVEEYGLRQVFPRVPGHPLLAGVGAESLRDWRGEATLLPPRLRYEMWPMHGPKVQWCGIDVSRLWRCGCRGNVASVLIEKPARGDFLPILDGGYSLQYSPLMEYRDGQGMILFCQLDVTGRSDREPAAEAIVANILRYAAAWKPAPARRGIYAGDPAGIAHLRAAGFAVEPYAGGVPAADQALIVGPGVGAALGAQTDGIRVWLQKEGALLAIGLNGAEASALLPASVGTMDREHIAAYFPAAPPGSPLAGIAPADVHNRDPRTMPLVTSGADIIGDGVLAVMPKAHAVLCQMAPWDFRAAAPMNVKRTYRRVSFLASRLAANLGIASSTPLPDRFGRPVQAGDGEKRWLDGLYLDTPEEWDDPYRFFGW